MLELQEACPVILQTKGRKKPIVSSSDDQTKLHSARSGCERKRPSDRHHAGRA